MVLFLLLLTIVFLFFYIIFLYYFFPFKTSGVIYETVLLDGALLPNFCVKEAKSLADRVVGLRNHYTLDKNQSLLLKGRIVSTYGMSFPIDILFLDKNGKILHINTNAMPSHFFYHDIRKTNYILEIRGGVADVFKLKKGSRLRFSGVAVS